ncbi:hypothetical protein DPEC_G00050470 [Dallia pectoralis]|uniref:Uncharacterized protein n=1 Tax=Dallia pectoralis TaxID=75939 RepID=A0ACC2HBP4_DALPE|nr:hypothetical protein DPEC_G00050470 [Dallia pectoralis]
MVIRRPATVFRYIQIKRSKKHLNVFRNDSSKHHIRRKDGINRTALSWNCVALLAIQLVFPIDSLEVIGGKRTVIQGEDADLYCRLSNTKEEFDQITWQKATKEDPLKHNFFVIRPNGITKNVNGLVGRAFFIGNTSVNLGSIQIRKVTLLDEGIYTCIFSVSSGQIQTEIDLTVLVPPVMTVTGQVFSVGENEVVLVTCIAAASKPQAEVRWITGSLNDSLRSVTNSTQHANGTSTVLSQLFGVPTRTANQKQVKCVVNQSALATERTLSYTLNIHYLPQTVNITVSSQGTSFQCVADGNPRPNYTWNSDGQPWPGSSDRPDGDTLHLLSSELNGIYVCEASNLYGRATCSLYVHTTSESSTVCWVLFVTLCLFVAAAIILWYLNRNGKLPCKPTSAPDPTRPEGARDHGSSTPLQTNVVEVETEN